MTTVQSPAVRIRRSRERSFEDFGWTDNWITFSFGEYRNPDWVHFGPLRVMVENHIQPRSGFPSHSHRDVEIVTYVAAGTLTHEDSFGHSAGVTAGEMQHISAGSRGMIHSERNVHDELEHNLQIWFIPDHRPTPFQYHQLGFAPAERQGRFRLYISPDARDGSMPIHTDAFAYAGLFSPGDRYDHRLADGRGAWVQMVRGRAQMGGLTIEEGDGVAITNTEKFELIFDAASEALLFDVRLDVPLIWR